MTAIKTAAELAVEAEAREDLRHFAAEIEYFDTHDLSEELANSPEVHFEINLPPRRRRYAMLSTPNSAKRWRTSLGSAASPPRPC